MPKYAVYIGYPWGWYIAPNCCLELEHCGDKLIPKAFDTQKEAEAVARNRDNRRGTSGPTVREYPTVAQ